MSMNVFERELWREAQTFLCNAKLKLRELYEWSTGECAPEDGEICVRLPSGFYICVPENSDKREKV